MNQFHNQEYSPTNKLPGFLFGIQAKKMSRDGNDPNEKMQSYVLQTPQNYTNRNVNQLHQREEAHVTAHQVKRMQQLPGVRSLTCHCQYPCISVDYDIPGFPLQVQLQALTPLIPGNAKDSAWPLATFDIVVTNDSSISGNTAVEVDVMQSALNFLGWDGHSTCCSNTVGYWHLNVNRPIVGDNHNDDNGTKSIQYAGWDLTKENHSIDPKELRGNLCLVGVVEDQKNDTDKNKKQLGLFVSDDTINEAQFWNMFIQRKFQKPSEAQPTAPSKLEHTYIGGVVQSSIIEPDTSKTFRFILTWHFPNRPCYAKRSNLPQETLGNRYAHWYSDAVDVMKQFLSRKSSDNKCAFGEGQERNKTENEKEEYNELIATTKKFVNTFYSSTLPCELLESAVGRLACMRSPTMFWTKDEGIVLGNEGKSI